MALPSADSLLTMQQKHPAGVPPNFQPTADPTLPPVFTSAQVEKADLSFRRSSAPGPSGLRPEHLRAAIKGAPANRAASALYGLTKMVNRMVAGEVPAEVTRYLCGALKAASGPSQWATCSAA